MNYSPIYIRDISSRSVEKNLVRRAGDPNEFRRKFFTVLIQLQDYVQTFFYVQWYYTIRETEIIKVLNNMPYFVYVVIMSRMAVFYFIITFHIFSRFPLL